MTEPPSCPAIHALPDVLNVTYVYPIQHHGPLHHQDPGATHAVCPAHALMWQYESTTTIINPVRLRQVPDEGLTSGEEAAKVGKALGIPVLTHVDKKPGGEARELEAYFG